LLSRAKHLAGSTVPVLIRFSNGSGNPTQPDNSPGVRGMAVKFTLPDGSTTDVSTQTARQFVSSTPDGFVDLLKAMRPGLTAPLRMARYFLTHPKLLGALPVLRDANRVPASYGTIEYHGLHAFGWIGTDGSTKFVRYHLVPAAGEKYLTGSAAQGKGPDFLTDELSTRLASGPVRFDFRVQIAGPKDSTVDPSAPWQSTEAVTVGTLEITGLDTERELGDDIVVFDPMRVTDGIEPSDDPVLRFRTLAYSASVKLRTGVDRGAEAPRV
jgi:catalase